MYIKSGYSSGEIYRLNIKIEFKQLSHYKQFVCFRHLFDLKLNEYTRKGERRRRPTQIRAVWLDYQRIQSIIEQSNSNFIKTRQSCSESGCLLLFVSLMFLYVCSCLCLFNSPSLSMFRRLFMCLMENMDLERRR